MAGPGRLRCELPGRLTKNRDSHSEWTNERGPVTIFTAGAGTFGVTGPGWCPDLERRNPRVSRGFDELLGQDSNLQPSG